MSTQTLQILCEKIIMKGEKVMATPEKSEQQVEQLEEHDLKGSLVSVLFIGFIILASWLGVWYLFLVR